MTDAQEPGPRQRFGFVAVLGAPNAGKSTLVNRIVGAKVSIVSPKVQTTRMRVMGIAIRGATQLVFIDTPGIFAPRRTLDRAMVDAAWQGAGEADRVLVLVDAARGIDEDTGRILDGLGKTRRTAQLVLNKVDKVKRPKLLALAAELHGSGLFTDVFMISALTGDGVDDLLTKLAAAMPEGPWHFPEHQISDIPLRLMAAEVVREKLFLQLHQELPYALTVETESWEEHDDGSVRIACVIIVARDSHKAMVIGKGGRQIKSVGETARKELEASFDRRVHLSLFVKVRRDWAERREHLSAMGLDFPGRR